MISDIIIFNYNLYYQFKIYRNKISIFEGQVLVKTQDGYFINSDYAKYDKEMH